MEPQCLKGGHLYLNDQKKRYDEQVEMPLSDSILVLITVLGRFLIIFISSAFNRIFFPNLFLFVIVTRQSG